MVFHIGVDYFQTACGKHEELRCRACNTVMDVKRSIMVQTGPYHPKSERDTFSCPNSGQREHYLKVRQILKGLMEGFY